MKFYYNEITLEVPESVYFPREDSELFANAIKKIDVKGIRALEVGCGSGFLSILLAKNGADVTAVDINEKAVEITKKNSDANDVTLKVIHSDLFDKVNDKFDLIIFNPPYLPVEEGETDPTYSGGKTGRDVIEKFISVVKNHLAKDGIVLMLISSLTGEKETIGFFEKHGMIAKVIERNKIPWEELIMIRADF